MRSIIPEKTFLEKIILLYEEFQKPAEKIRTHRMSRHLYDIFSIYNTKSGKSALKDIELFRAICDHRAVFTPIKGVDYDALNLAELNILPTGDFVGLYKADYQAMRENMFHGESPDFEEILEVVGEILK